MPKKLLFIIGSNRKNSFNRQLAQQIISLVGTRAQCAFLDYSDVPVFCQDDEYPPSAELVRLRDTVANADALWLLTPEYNGSYPGLLKNVLDWLSRPVTRNDYSTPTVMRGKKMTISGAAGKSASIHARNQLAQLLRFLGADLYNEAGFGVVLTPDAFSSDKLVLSDDVQTDLRRFVDGFLSFIQN